MGAPYSDKNNGGNTYTVQFGDNLISIARRYGTTVDAIAKANGISNPNLIHTGAKLTIPGVSASGGNNQSNGATTYQGYTKFDPGTYTESGDVTSAKNKAKDAAGAVELHPDFTYDKETEYNSLWEEYMGRDDFNYDFNADALYQQYKDKYIKQGKMAMQDTIGQASAMTGGYGNSYAATVGNQAYQASLENLNDVIPQLYQMAYDRHNQKGQDMRNKLGMYESDRAYKYGIDQDQYDRLVQDRTYYQGIADNVSEDDYNRWLDMVGINQTEHTNAENNAYNMHRDSIEDDRAERALKMQEEEWELSKQQKYYNSGGDNDNNSGGNNDTGGDGEDEASMYADWGGLDWEGYFATIRNTESKSAAEAELNRMIKAGLIPQNMITYASIGARGSMGH